MCVYETPDHNTNAIEPQLPATRSSPFAEKKKKGKKSKLIYRRDKGIFSRLGICFRHPLRRKRNATTFRDRDT
jgi:hypothetical protein